MNTEAGANYDPSETEIVEYGKWLGMKLPDDNPFLWIAKEGLKAPLPENWKGCQSDKGELYYFNFKTGQSIWDHPMDDHFKDLFKNEKDNPTPRSIAGGAKRKDTPSAGEKPKRKKKGPKKKPEEDRSSDDDIFPVHPKSRDLSPSHAVPTNNTTTTSKNNNSTATTTTTTNSHNHTKNSAKEEPSKAHGLKPLQGKKELPAGMRLDFDGNSAPKKLALQQPASIVTTQPRFAATQSDSSGEVSPLRVTSPAAKANGPTQVDAAPVKGGTGVKSLCRMSESNKRPSSSDSSGEASGDLRLVAEERGRSESAARAEIASLQARLAKEKHQEEERLKMESSKAVDEQREKCDREREAKLKELKMKLEYELREEQRTMENELRTSVEQAKKEMLLQKSTEIRRLKDSFKEQLEQEKRKLAEELVEKLEFFAREQRDESEAKNTALSHSARESGRALENEFGSLSTGLVRSYEESYSAFSRAITSSQNDFALRSVRQKEESQRELDGQLTEIRSEHQRAVDQERSGLQAQITTLQTKFAADKAKIIETREREIQQLQNQSAVKLDELRSVQGKEFAAVFASLDTARVAHVAELEALRDELKKKAADELKAAMAELAEERRRSMAASSHRDPDRSPSVRVSGDDVVARPPRLDGNLLFDDMANPDAYAALRDSQARDIRTAVTEALRKVFSESPFTLASPARGSPQLHSPSQLQRASFSGSSPAFINSTAAPPTRPVRQSSFPLPVSFQEQRALVESERKRVRDGRSFVESQRKNLEERRQQLRRTRHQWKQDVMVAKRDGVRSSSTRGEVLNQVRIALEEQTRGLEHDEAILRESMVWLQSKETRLLELQLQIEEQERTRLPGDNSMANVSLDTAALVTGYFKPQRTPTFDPAARRMSLSAGAMSGGLFTPFESPATTPVFANALSRIERRLDEVTSMIHFQKAQSRGVSPTYPLSGSHRVSLSSPSHANIHRRSSRSNSRALMDDVRESNAEQL